MVAKKFLDNFILLYFSLKHQFNKIYKNSNFYDKKISKVFENHFQYKPSPFLLSSIINYQKKNIKLKTFP